MQAEHAEHTLETIRTLMERSQRYEHISGASGLVAGSTALVGCVVLANGWLSFAVVWSTVFGIAFVANALFTFARARRRDEPVWSRQARTVLLAVLPALIGGLAASVVLWRLDKLDWLPAFWLVFYGCGTLATSFFAPRSIAWLGGACLTLGILSLCFTAAHPILTMALGFGLTHLGFGVSVITMESRAARAQAFWREVNELAQTDPN